MELFWSNEGTVRSSWWISKYIASSFLARNGNK